MSHLRASLPALLLLLFSTWCGTFHGAAYGLRALTGHLVLLGVLAAVGDVNPLRLSRRGHLLLGLLLLLFALSLLLSPTPRAGRVGLLLLPAYLMLPRFVERCWGDPESTRRGLLAVAGTVGAVAAWSLFAWWRLETPGASLPLGHHNLLAAWLVALFPLALLPWRDGGAARVVAGTAGLLALAAMLATHSLSGLGALAVMLVAAVLMAAPRQRRRGAVLGALVLLTIAFVGRSRLLAVVTGNDLSAAARLGYLEAAARGFLERPFFGWGPGSASWTLGRFLRPRPGVHPPDQVVADPHSLPFRLAYESGALGLALLVAVSVVVLRTRWREQDGDAMLRRAAFCGLLGWGVASLAGRPLAAPALPLAVLLLLGALQACRPIEPPPEKRRGWVAVALGIALLIGPADVAHLAYDRAVSRETPEEQARLLRRAVRLDPYFPLYPVRLALAESRPGRSSPSRSSLARRAAERAGGIAHFHLLAGVLSLAEGEPGARDALLAACDLNPLGALAPFHLAVSAGDDHRAPVWAARALLADPVLLAAEALHTRPGLTEAALAELRWADAVDRAWVLALSASYERARHVDGPTRRLVLEMDGDSATALSLHAFRRLPWPVRLDEVRVFADALPEIAVGAASRARVTDARLFQAPECGLPGTPGAKRDAP